MTDDPVREKASCYRIDRHPAHDWDYKQDWGPQVMFYYRCPGIKDITIKTWE